MRRIPMLISALVLVLTVVACTRPTVPVDTSYSVRGTAYTDHIDPSPVPLGVSLFLINDDVFSSALVAPNSFIALNDEFFVGPISPVGADGHFDLVFPDGDDIPESTMTSAADFVVNARAIGTCTITASDAAASVTTALFEFVSVPGLVMYSVEGAALSFITTEPIAFDDPEVSEADYEYVTWVYADRAVNVSTGAGCSEGSFEVSVEVALQAGWNQLVWRIAEGEGGDPDVLSLHNSSANAVHAYFGFSPF